MTETTKRLGQLIKSGLDYFSRSSESEMSTKHSPEKWSKKEILGHLIDSGINNLQRFTEIQTENKPYKIRKYKQDELVKSNNYQGAELDELTRLWAALNQRIVKVMESQTQQTLSYEIQLPDGASSDLRFLMVDYVDHLEYHLKQIMN
ncbi:DinB family protein [Fluviicola sp.]|uniref:DinB family protein n=1 Tax=Fluviicola sp. TaxID=1917219 RepID=UPI003D26684D